MPKAKAAGKVVLGKERWVADWYYVYYKSGEDWVYERTCGSEAAAKERVEELKKRYDDANYYDDVKEGAFY